MIWFLLYPFRGTTEPPILAPNHPIRKAFYRYGTAASRHWLASILFSVAIGVLLCYPAFFLYENPTTGFSKLPNHVWTSARAYEGAGDVRADVAIRQIWVHGSYMRALDRHVLQEALGIQEMLVADDVRKTSLKTVADGQNTPSVSWGFHSPLMFWNCSHEVISDDTDILRTINEHAHKRSYLNLTLRPTSVFAGKSFAKDKIVAADALVITLFDREGSEHIRQWTDRISSLAAKMETRWSLYPEDGMVAHSQLYEFQQKPLSYQDNIFLILVYVCMALYVAGSLGKLRAVKSRAGLIATGIIQIAVSILGSFSICGVLKIDLARIPDAAYPFVVLVMGLENMFRLINAVIVQPPQLTTTHRVANALGNVSHLSLATSGQMLIILWLLSNFAPGVAAFCIFAAIALIIDFLFHLTFFVAVLSVDVRRMELQDSLDRVDKHHPHQRSERKYWLQALLRGSLPFSSRIAGSVVSICFIFALNMHFYDYDSLRGSISQSLKSLFRKRSVQQTTSFAPPAINQARTPAAWLRIQDYRYAQEVLKLVKPQAHSIIARVYDPLLIVLEGSDRTGIPAHPNSFIMGFIQLLGKHLYPFIFVVVLTLAIVTLLMQYLLWNELSEEEPEGSDLTKQMTIMTLPKAHVMDIIGLEASPRGHIISVGLDRHLSLYTYDSHLHTFFPTIHDTSGLPTPLWPVVAVALDDDGMWAAVCTLSGRIALWNLPERKIYQCLELDLENQRPSVFTLTTVHPSDGEKLRLVVGVPDGTVTEFDVLQPRLVQSFHLHQCQSKCLTILRSKSILKIISLSKGGRVLIASNRFGEWITAPLDPRESSTQDNSKVRFVLALPTVSAIALVHLGSVDLVDMKTQRLVHTFSTPQIKPRSLSIMTSTCRDCRICGSAAVHSLALVYTRCDDSTCVMATHTLSDDHTALFCLRPQTDTSNFHCKTITHTTLTTHTIPSPGSWHATNSQSIIGIRPRRAHDRDPPCAPPSPSASTTSASPTTSPGISFLTRRGAAASSAPFPAMPSSSPSAYSATAGWEVYTLAATGDFHAQSLVPAPGTGATEDEDDAGAGLDVDEQLFVAHPGPMVRLGNGSVAVGFGNRVKVLTVGSERFDREAVEFGNGVGAGVVGGTGRRRRAASRRAAH
ncbi:hypothetical protein EJ06DRAFT_508948 [Trichodelitschia bisporula]|uniref:Sterol regulatory element-binding protein cleavage-activating protein n=1 Tax=Trichodelitschia bisporula TaxID=703511 RepID=A0A6G1I048_9PEZI|nr:hypothetical protein EJ06DRAFT_508948 [Trichodelitschia bisporula]